MAKKLVLDENKKFNIKYSKVGKNSSFYYGEKDTNIFNRIRGNDKYNRRYTEFGGLSLVDLKKKIVKSLDGFTTNTPEKILSTINLLKNDGCLKEDDLNKLGNKELKNIYKVLSKMHLLIRDYQKRESMLNSPFGANAKQKYEQAFDVYAKALDGINRGLSDLHKLQEFDTDAFARDIEKQFKISADPNAQMLDSNLSATHKRDLEVVRALEFVGINLKQTRVNGQILWEYDITKTNDNKNGISYQDENGQQQYFKLDAGQIRSFLKEYLNKSAGERNNTVITPEGIFKLYLEEATAGLNTRFGKVVGFGKEGNQIVNFAIKNATEKFSTKSAEWNKFVHASDRLAVMDGAKLALMGLYATDGLTKDEDIISQELQDQIQANPYVNSKCLNRLANNAENIRNGVNNQKIQYAVADSFLTKCESEKERLENKTSLSDIEKETLESINRTIETIGIVQSFVKEVALKVNKENKAEWLQTINMLSESDLIQISKEEKGYQIAINNENNLISDNLLDICNAVINEMNNKLASANKNDQNSDEMTEEDIFAQLFEKTTENEANNLGNGIKQWTVYDFTDNFFSNCSEDNEFNVLINKYRELRKQDPANPNYDTFQSFVESTFTEEQKKDFGSPFFTLDALSNYEARTRENTEIYKSSNTYKTAMDSYEEMTKNSNKFISMLVRTRSNISSLSPNVEQLDITPELFKNAYSRTLNEMQSPEFKLTEEEEQIAKLYKDYTQRAYAKNVLESYNQGNKINDGSKLSNDLLNYCSKMFTDKELEDNIASISSNSGNSQSNQPGNNKDVEKVVEKIKFSDKYPKDKTGKLLKKFKPFCDKSTAKIIDKMLEMIEKCDLLVEKKKGKDGSYYSDYDDFDEDEQDNQNNNGDQTKQTDKSQDNSQSQTGNDNLDPNKDKNATVGGQDRPVEGQNDNSGKSSSVAGDNGNNRNPQNAVPNSGQKTQQDKGKSSNGLFADNTMGLPDGEFATFKILSVGLRAVLTASSFARNREWLSEDEKEKISAVSKIMDYVTKPSEYAPDSEEYKTDLELKKFLAGELDLKAKTPSDSRTYNAGLRDNVKDFLKQEFGNVINDEMINTIDSVSHNCKNIEDIGQLMIVTTDLPSENDIELLKGGGSLVQMKSGEKFKIGNKLSQEDIQTIASCKNDTELWSFIRKNNELYQSLWNVPGSMSQKLADYLKQMQQEEGQNSFSQNYEENFQEFER